MKTTHQLFDVVYLTVDLPKHGLKIGQPGTIVEVYSDTDYEVEFVENTGKTICVLTMKTNQFQQMEVGDEVLHEY